MFDAFFGKHLLRKDHRFASLPRTEFILSHVNRFSLPLDINECESPDVCDGAANARCKNTMRSYKCSCNIGYEGDGRNCTGKLLVHLMQM